MTKANDLVWFNSFLSDKVAPSYVNAFRTLKNNIVDPLLTFKQEDSTQNDANVKGIVSLAQGITCATKQLYNDLSTALKASEELNAGVEKKMSEVISEISQKENALRDVNNQLAQIDGQLNEAQARVNHAEADVRGKEGELASADGDLNAQQRRLNRARECGKRKKRFLRRVLKAIVRPICSVFNSGGIRRAKERRASAQGAVNAAREQLTRRQQELQNQRSQQVNFRNQQAERNGQKQSLSLILTRLQAQQVILANMTQQMRKVIQHIKSFASKSSVLYDELRDLVSFENLVEPLNAILTELIQSGVRIHQISGATQVSLAEVGLSHKVIDLLKARLPSLPLNEENSKAC